MKRTASAVWSGDLKSGKGTISTQTGVVNEARFGFASRLFCLLQAFLKRINAPLVKLLQLTHLIAQLPQLVRSGCPCSRCRYQTNKQDTNDGPDAFTIPEHFILLCMIAACIALRRANPPRFQGGLQ